MVGHCLRWIWRIMSITTKLYCTTMKPTKKLWTLLKVSIVSCLLIYSVLQLITSRYFTLIITKCTVKNIYQGYPKITEMLFKKFVLVLFTTHNFNFLLNVLLLIQYPIAEKLKNSSTLILFKSFVETHFIFKSNVTFPDMNSKINKWSYVIMVCQQSSLIIWWFKRDFCHSILLKVGLLLRFYLCIKHEHHSYTCVLPTACS